MMKKSLFLGVVAALGMSAATVSAEVDPNLPSYERVSGISGNLSSVGSDTLNNQMTLWAEQFASIYPNVNIQIQGAGSSTAPPALIEGTSNFGPMSRAMRDSEVREFEEKFGYPPTQIPVAIDMVAVYVNKDNPIESLTLEQVDAIFSATRACGADKDINTWGDAGMTGAWANRDITIYGRNAVSGTYGFFKENALCGGDFKSTVNEQPGSSGIGYKTSGVRAVPLNGVEATSDNAVSGDFPLARFLFIYANQHPNDGWNPLEKEFLRMVLSKEGQEVVVKDGYVPLSAAAAERFRNEKNLD